MINTDSIKQTIESTTNTMKLFNCKHCGHFPDCRRHRRDEHYAGFGNRANQGNRHPDGYRSKTGRYIATVFD